MLAARAARAVAQRRAAPASHRGFAAGDTGGSAASKADVASGNVPVAVGHAASGLFTGGGIIIAAVLLRDGLKEGGEAFGNRVKEGAAYVGVGAALFSSVAGVVASAVAVGTRLLGAAQAGREPAGGKALPGSQCAGAPDNNKAAEHLLSADARAATDPHRRAGNCKPAQGGKV